MAKSDDAVDVALRRRFEIGRSPEQPVYHQMYRVDLCGGHRGFTQQYANPNIPMHMSRIVIVMQVMVSSPR